MRIILSTFIFLITSTVLISSCGTTDSLNDTAFDYYYDESLINATHTKIMLAPVSLGVPVRNLLRKGELRTKSMVKNYLQDNGFTFESEHHFDNAWKQAIRNNGEIYDPSTGRLDVEAWRAAMITTGDYLAKNTDVELLVFADLIEHDVQHSNSSKHYARWYGVTRKASLQGAGNGVPQGFDWSQSIKAASIMVTIYDVKTMRRVFSSRGGIDTLYGVDMRSSNPSFVRRKKILASNNFIEEGIELAFHPFIPMENYPENSNKAENSNKK